jgi:hypothetical protein
MREALKISVAYMPIKATGWVVELWLTHAHVFGYVPHPFMREYWRYLDVARAEAAP